MKLFDEFGNAVGDFAPAGEGYAGFVFLLIGLALLLVGFIFYAIYKLIRWIVESIIKGIKNAKAEQSNE